MKTIQKSIIFVLSITFLLTLAIIYQIIYTNFRIEKEKEKEINILNQIGNIETTKLYIEKYDQAIKHDEIEKKLSYCKKSVLEGEKIILKGSLSSPDNFIVNGAKCGLYLLEDGKEEKGVECILKYCKDNKICKDVFRDFLKRIDESLGEGIKECEEKYIN